MKTALRVTLAFAGIGLAAVSAAQFFSYRAGQRRLGELAREAGVLAQDPGLLEAISREPDPWRARLRLARTLLAKNPTVLRHAKSAFKFVESLDWDTSEAMLGAMAAASAAADPERGRRQGMSQFLDDKSYRPGLEGYRREV